MTGKSLHSKAGDLRESGKFLESLQTIIEAIYLYSKEKDYVGLTDAEGDASLTLRHLYHETNDNSYLILAEGFANSAVETASGKGLRDGMARPLFDLAKVIEEMDGFPQAVEKYKEAIAIFELQPQSLHNRAGVLADMKLRLAICEYKSGNKLAFGDALSAMEDLEESDEKEISKYNYDVWLSGAHMKIGEMLKKDDIEKAKDHLRKAKEIMDKNPDLKLRRKQLEDLNGSF